MHFFPRSEKHFATFAPFWSNKVGCFCCLFFSTSRPSQSQMLLVEFSFVTGAGVWCVSCASEYLDQFFLFLYACMYNEAKQKKKLYGVCDYPLTLSEYSLQLMIYSMHYNTHVHACIAFATPLRRLNPAFDNRLMKMLKGVASTALLQPRK